MELPRAFGKAVPALLAGLLLAGCGGLTGGEEPPMPERIAIDEAALQSEETPSLASVPETPPTVTPPDERAALERSLRDDRARARGEPPPAPWETAEEDEAVLASVITINPDAMPPDPAAGGVGAASASGTALAGPPAGLVGVIHFVHASTALDGRDREILRQVAQLWRERGGRLRVLGHASSRTDPLDPQRHAEVNLRISRQRAEAVAAELRAAGVPADALLVEGLGDRGRVYHEFMVTGEAGNRRVEIFLQD